MSTIVFVRHGQASLFAEDYDNLSEAGHLQAKELGRYIHRYGLSFDELYIGPRRRHAQTVQALREQAPHLPDAAVISEFDEHHVDHLVSSHLDALCERFPELTARRNAFHAAAGMRDRQRAFARLFEAVADLWVTGTCPLFGVESWSDFCQRVNSGIDRILSQKGRGRRVLVSASAGTIVAALHRALDCPETVALGLGWRIWNCSLTQFAFSGKRFTLDTFNSMAHLEDRSLWTYR